MDLFDTNSKQMYAEVLLPKALPGTFCYVVPAELQAEMQIGVRVIVPFGSKNQKLHTGVVVIIHDNLPSGFDVKPILDIMDTAPIVTPVQIEFFNWMAHYYMCHAGEVLNNALPSGLKIHSESKIEINPLANFNKMVLDITEQLVVETLRDRVSLRSDELPAITGQKNFVKLVRTLSEKGIITVFEELKDKYSPKKEQRYRLSEKYVDKEALEELFFLLQTKTPQLNVLMIYLQNVPVMDNVHCNEGGMKKKDLQEKNASMSSLKTLTDKGIFEVFEVVISRFPKIEMDESYELVFNEAQQKSVYSILNHFEEKSTVLLHGVTGSGKTEIYIDLIKKALENGSQVLYLLPEIGLTTQIVNRLQLVFGEKMGVFHSKHSASERVEIWNGVLSGMYSFVIGVRSAIFLPFQNLGLIVVDEEHDSSFKQFQTAPRFHARDSAIMLAKLHDAKVIMGTATPSIESYYHAINGNFGLVTLPQRYANAKMPLFYPVKSVYLKGENRVSFGPDLKVAIEESLAKKEQVLLFQNKRGYAPFLMCGDCAETIDCPNCAVSLTYYMYSNELKCHYCGYMQAVPTNCSACGSQQVQLVGVGTEKIEEDIKVIFPKAEVQRMDVDTTKRKNGYQEIIDGMTSGAIDILIGTQMVTKGLDFEKVNLVGVFDADRMLHSPDFRSYERAFQIITQVGGRSGRRDKQGKVLIQTNLPTHPVMQDIVNNNFGAFYGREIKERKQYNYPPFSRMIKITIKDADKKQVNKSANRLSQLLVAKLLQKRVLGPQEPSISKIRNVYLMELFIKIERGGINLNQAKDAIQFIVDHIATHKDYRSSRFVIDVDMV